MKFLKIKKAVLTPDQYGHTMTISMVGIYEQDGKFIKWIKIKEAYEMLMSEDCVIMIHEKQE